MVIHSKTCRKQQTETGKCICGWKEINPIILKQCPFCGRNAKIVHYGIMEWGASCSVCDAQRGRRFNSPEAAADAWNIRLKSPL
jgi:hypothetical protein